MKIIITSLLFFFLSSNANSQIIGPKDIVKSFFEKYEKEGISVALDQLYGTNKWVERNQDAIVKLKNEMEGLNVDYVGEYYGYEFITQKAISDSYLLLSYLVKFDRQPIRYTFQFYKPADEWILYAFKYDGNLGAELEESAKIYYLNYGY